MESLSLRILVAEDSSVNQKILLRMLKQVGCSAALVSNGKEAIVAVNRFRYDIVFMDVHMPEMDGLEATKTIMNSRCAAERPKIVALTADALPGDKEKCIEAGMDDYITKPVHLQDIVTMLKRWVPLKAPSVMENDVNKRQYSIGQTPIFTLAQAN